MFLAVFSKKYKTFILDTRAVSRVRPTELTQREPQVADRIIAYTLTE